MKSNHISTELTQEDLYKALYFILMKFNADSYHMQGTSSKSDLLGGYIDRWFNKAAEALIFNKLLEDRNYKVSSDYFLYGNDTDKNAPDILGIENPSKVVPFVQFNDGNWERIEKRPRIEIKVFRNTQSLFSIRDSQLINDYYAIIQSDLEPGYLSTVFEDSLFNKLYLDSLKVNDIYVKSDVNNSLIRPFEIKKPTKIGNLRLVGIYTDDVIRDISLSYAEKENPYYLGSVENVTRATGKKIDNILTIDITGIVKYTYEGNKYLPFYVHNYDGYSLDVLAANKTSLYIQAPKPMLIDGNSVDAGIVKISFKNFDRSSKWTEYISTLSFIENYASDSTSELLETFDTLMG